MEVIISSSNQVTIDGVSVGNVCDAFLNRRDDAGAIYDALTAYEETLRQATAEAVEKGKAATAAVQELLDVANARIHELETQASADRDAYATAMREAQAAFDSQMAAAATEFSDSLTTARSDFDTRLQAAQAAVTTAQAKQAMAESCERAHCNLNTVLLSKGDCDAAVAAVQEINRTNQAREKAKLLAQIAAMPAE